MAKNLKADDEPTEATPLANVGNRKAILQKAASEIRALQSEAEGHRAKIKGLNKSVGDVFRKIKSDLGIKRKSFEAIMELIDLPEEDFGQTVDEYREVYEALKPGEQMDWLSTRSASESTNTLQ